MNFYPQPNRVYRVKKKRRAVNEDDPVWQEIQRMQRVRKKAMREATEAGEPYRDPFADRLSALRPISFTSSPSDPPRDPDDPVWKGILHIREVRKKAMRKALETGQRYRDPYRHVLPPPPEENSF
jgi:hypothetical protein